jgi:hypothetical protein
LFDKIRELYIVNMRSKLASRYWATIGLWRVRHS